MKRIVTALVAMIALAGCGHDVYQRADTTDTQYLQDENSCFSYAEKQPLAAVGGSAHDNAYALNIERQRKDIRACMVAKGYTLAPKWPFGPYGISPTGGPDPTTMPLATTR